MSALGMPPALLALFALRPALPAHKPPTAKLSQPLSSFADVLDQFELTPAPAPARFVSPIRKKLAMKLEGEKRNAELISNERKTFRAKVLADPNLTQNPKCTLIVANLAYAATTEELFTLFEPFGELIDIRLVEDRQNKSRGYAFVEFAAEDAAAKACWELNNKPFKDRALLVDFEKARVNAHFFPNRLAGGEGRNRAYVILRRVLRALKKQLQKQHAAQNSKVLMRRKRVLSDGSRPRAPRRRY